MPKASDTIVPRNNDEALIDLRRRYARCVRMVWTMLGISILLTTALGLTLYHHTLAMKQITRLADDLEVQARVSEGQERQRRIDRAEQRYSLCQRPAEQRPAEPLCDGYESLDAAYASEGVGP